MHNITNNLNLVFNSFTQFYTQTIHHNIKIIINDGLLEFIIIIEKILQKDSEILLL